ncbi:MAG TPA: hypothetical protein VM779_05705 [Thermoanaerobaculia bacterium]|nr:hypothetical protein [Thermoanaerobaculia bacterium]
MKRTLLFLALLLVALSASAEGPRERDVLLTSEGFVYTVEAISEENPVDGTSGRYLRMTVQHGEERSTAPVPATLIGGAHGHPALAYDMESQTLFLFWQEMLFHGLSSRLLFASYEDGVWSDVTALDSVDWKLRRNLRIAVTQSIQAVDEEGNTVQVPQIVVHAVWWEETGSGEWARYAMLGIDDGIVTSTDFRYLTEFTGTSMDDGNAAGHTDNEVLTHPAIFTNPSRDSVEILFGDVRSDAIRRLRIKPVLDGRVRIPIGVRGGNLRNVALNFASGSRVAAVISEETIALYAVSEEQVDYVVYRHGVWSKQRKVVLTEELPPDTAVDALRRMVAAQ